MRRARFVALWMACWVYELVFTPSRSFDPRAHEEEQ